MKKTTFTAAVIGLSLMMTAGTASAAAKTHVTNDTDTFWKVSKQYNVSVDSLLDANSKIDPLNIYKGLKLTIPTKDVSASSKPNATILNQSGAGMTIKGTDGKTYSYSKALNVQATAYTAAASENGKWGAVDYFGNKLKVGTIAVDPKMIPLGTKLYVTGYDYNGLPTGGMIATATDIGGSIKGNRVDLFVPGTTSQAMKFGIQDIKVYIIK